MRRTFIRLGVFATVIALSAAPAVVSADTPPDGGDLGRSWSAAYDAPPKYPGPVHIDIDVPITMSDGTVLKANIYRPVDAAGRVVDTPLPTIVNLTPYTKFASLLADFALSVPVLSDALVQLIGSVDLTGTPLESITDLTQALSGGAARSFGANRKIVQQGYTYVVADVRGTGYSQGDWKFFQERETQDTIELLDWTAGQPWSDGNIGMSGISYSGINQFKVAEKNPPALKAIFPIEGSTDTLTDVALPGGGLGMFAPVYILGVDLLQFVGDPAAMMLGHLDYTWLLDRINSPLEFFDYMLMALALNVNSVPEPLKRQLEPGSPLRSAFTDNHPERIRVPTFAYGGWQDIFASSSARSFQDIPLPPERKKLIMGNTYHANPGSGLGKPGRPPRLDVLQLAWFDRWLKGIDNGIEEFGPIALWQQGGGWTTAASFPRPGMDYQRMYLSVAPSGTARSVHDGTLVQTPDAPARLTVSPITGITSLCSRDAAVESAGALSIFPVCAADDRIHELGGLTFTSPPVTEPTLLSGPVNIHLNTAYDNIEGYWAVSINDVAPDGRSTVLASGQLAASLRAVDESKSSRDTEGNYTRPVYKLTLADRQPLMPGRPTVLDIAVNPTDAVLQPGHRLRVNVFASNFPRGILPPPLLFDGGLLNAFAPQHLLLDPAEPSWVNLPLSRPLG